jgi:ATP-dependent RNA helicase DeaD
VSHQPDPNAPETLEGVAPETHAAAEAPAPTVESPAEEVILPTAPVSEWVSARTFADFPISPDLLRGLTALGYDRATPVQAMTIDPALAGKDLLVRAKTGTGKTCAFCVPVLENIGRAERTEGVRRPAAIMLAPTRELAIQVAQECTAIGKFLDVRIAVIYGGVGFGAQEDALREGVDIVVGTPGRVLDHVRRGNLDLSAVRLAVLDEADEMLSMGFVEDVRKILDKTPSERQGLFVSATINESVKGLIRKYLREPEEIYLSVDGDNVSSIQHILYETSPDYHKARALLDLIEKERPKAAIIFCNTREDVNTVHAFLERQGLGVEMISGELPQAKREKVMARVKAGAVQFLVSTDVAARGIDISGLTHVVNYSLPEDAAVYLHRCGRTGRIGNQGTAITLAGGSDFSTRLTLERSHKIAFEVRALPTPEESRALAAERMVRTLKEASGTMAFEACLHAARALKERPDADMLIAVALRAFLQWDRQRKLDKVDADSGEAPVESREGGREERRDRGGREERRDRGGRDERRDRGGRGERREEGRRDERREDARRDERRGDRPARPVEPAAAEDAGETEEVDVAAETGETGEARKRKRRRRKKKGTGEAGARPEGTEGESEGVAESEGQEVSDGDGAETGESAEGSGAAGEDGQRRRRRRRRGGRGRGEGSEGGDGGEGVGDAPADGGASDA